MKSAVAAGHAARRIQPLLERGRAAFVARMRGEVSDDIVQAYEKTDMAIVTLDDFVLQPRLVHEFVVRVKSIQVLDDTGELSALISPRRPA